MIGTHVQCTRVSGLLLRADVLLTRKHVIVFLLTRPCRHVEAKTSATQGSENECVWCGSESIHAQNRRTRGGCKPSVMVKILLIPPTRSGRCTRWRVRSRSCRRNERMLKISRTLTKQKNEQLAAKDRAVERLRETLRGEMDLLESLNVQADALEAESRRKDDTIAGLQKVIDMMRAESSSSARLNADIAAATKRTAEELLMFNERCECTAQPCVLER